MFLRCNRGRLGGSLERGSLTNGVEPFNHDVRMEFATKRTLDEEASERLAAWLANLFRLSWISYEKLNFKQLGKLQAMGTMCD
jgi:hypothetical protein